MDREPRADALEALGGFRRQPLGALERRGSNFFRYRYLTPRPISVLLSAISQIRVFVDRLCRNIPLIQMNLVWRQSSELKHRPSRPLLGS